MSGLGFEGLGGGLEGAGLGLEGGGEGEILRDLLLGEVCEGCGEGL